MKCIIVLVASGLLAAGVAAAPVQAGADTIDIGVSLHDGDLEGFHLSLGEYFQVPQQEIIVIEQQRIPYYEVPVVYHISQYMQVPSTVIINLRLGGSSWIDICTHCGCTAEIFYVPVPVDISGPPYGHAYGHYKHKPKSEWKNILLSDDDVINLVNLKFISEHFTYPPEEVIRIRSGGRDFAGVHHEVLQRVDSHKANGSDSSQGGKSASQKSGSFHGKEKSRGSKDHRDSDRTDGNGKEKIR